MASRQLVAMYAMYVIGEVESNWDWDNIYYVDPITIGMMQNYAYNAADHLMRHHDANDADWAYLVANAPTITNDLLSHNRDSSWWTTRYLHKGTAESNAIQHIMQGNSDHVIQQTRWIEEANRYIDKLLTDGMTLNHPRELIFAMSMYHQTPKRCNEVLAAVGGTATLDRLFAGAMNNSVLSNYRPRYTTNYNRLKAWDETSDPPDFGQVIIPDPDSEREPSPSTTSAELSHIIQMGDTLVLYGRDKYKDGVIFNAASGQRWVNANGTINTPTVPPDTHDPGTPEPTADATRQKLVDFVATERDRYYYSQNSGRLSPDTSGYADCSSYIWYAYKKCLGIIIAGTTTASMQGTGPGYGTIIYNGHPSGLDASKLKKGDLIFYFNGDNTGVHHVEIVMGASPPTWGMHTWGTTGPSPSTYTTWGHDQHWIRVRRYIND